MKQEEKEIFWIDWVQLILIGLIFPFFLFPSMKYVWIFLIVPGIWICRWIVKKHLFERTVLDWAFAVLFIHVFSTCLIVPDLAFSLPKIAGAFFGLCFFYSIVALMTSKKLIRWGIISFLGTGLLLSIVCLLGIRWVGDREIYFNKIISTIERIIPKIKWNLPGAEEGFNSNAIGGTLILIIPLCLVLLLLCLKRKKESYFIFYNRFSLIFLFMIFFVMIGLLFFTLSIGSWIALITSLWILLLPWKWKKRSFVLIVLFIVVIFLARPKEITLINNTFKTKILKRDAYWLVGVKEISKHPFFGIGMNRIRQLPSVGYERSHVHNHFLHTAAELGIPGLIAYLAILIGSGFMCFEIWHKSDIGWMRMSALGLGCGQLAYFIFGMGDSIPLGAKVGIFFWFSLGLITAIYNYMLNRN